MYYNFYDESVLNFVIINFSTVACLVSAINVNMQGSLVLGKDVVESLSYYLGKNMVNTRRSLTPPPIEDAVTLAVRAASVCRDLHFCYNNLQHFVNEYVIILAKTVESVLNSAQTDFSAEKYEQKLRYSLEYIRKVLEDVNAKTENENYEYYWIQTIKKINAKFQEMLQHFVPDAKESDESYKNKAKTILNRNTFIATAFIERKYVTKLCLDHKICSTSYECTTTLSKILFHFKTLSEDRIRMFIKHVYETLFDTSFYSHLKYTTAHEFQVILNDLSYSNESPTKDMMLAVQKTVEARLEMIKMNKVLDVGHDILLAHTILSDLDHMYSNRTEPFIFFLNRFYDWLASDVAIDKPIRAVVMDISKTIWSHDEELVTKLINEVNVFLDMTVEPEE